MMSLKNIPRPFRAFSKSEEAKIQKMPNKGTQRRGQRSSDIDIAKKETRIQTTTLQPQGAHLFPVLPPAPPLQVDCHTATTAVEEKFRHRNEPISVPYPHFTSQPCVVVSRWQGCYSSWWLSQSSVPLNKPFTQSLMSDSPTIRDHLPPHKQAQNFHFSARPHCSTLLYAAHSLLAWQSPSHGSTGST